MAVDTSKVWLDFAPDRIRKHKLITEEIAQKIPPMGEMTEDYECDFGSIVPTVKLFSRFSGGTGT